MSRIVIAVVADSAAWIHVGGAYRLLHKIGEGAFGQIYLGEHVRNGEKAVPAASGQRPASSLGKLLSSVQLCKLLNFAVSALIAKLCQVVFLRELS